MAVASLDQHLYAILIVLFVGVWLLSQSFYIREQGGRALVVRVAVVHRWVAPGLTFRVPLVDRIVRLDPRKYPPEYPAGKNGRVVTRLTPSGYVRLEGERWMWRATSLNGAAGKRDPVRVHKFEQEKLFCKRRS